MKKAKVLEGLKSSLTTKIVSLESELHDIQLALSQDSKSTAGDKHETSRAMAQLEQEKLGKQLGDMMQMYQRVTSIDQTSSHEFIQLGSLVQTSNGMFFIGIPFGQLIIDNEAVFCLSPVAPLGQLLLNKKSLESIVLNGNTIDILSVV